MLKIKINGCVYQFDVYNFSLNEWLKMSDLIIKEYGFNNFIRFTYEVLKGDPFISDEYNENGWNY